jgi:hypothetical protein
MKRKLLVICIVGTLLMTNFLVLNNVAKNITNSDIGASNNVEMLDQYQNDSQGFPLLVGQLPSESENISIQVAQSFVPQKAVLTKVELLIGKNGTTTYPFVMAIRESLTGANMRETQVEPSEVETENFSWIEFDFTDLIVNIDQTYYIVGYTENVTDNWYLWSANNYSASYPNGDAWISTDEGDNWTNKSRTKSKPKPFPVPHPLGIMVPFDDDNQSDMCFKTYGKDATELEISFQFFGKGLYTTIKNIGTVNATGVTFEINVKGGMLGGINETTGGIYLPPIEPDEEVLFNTTLFGLGFVDVTASVYASNARLVTKATEGIVIFSYIFVLPSS